MAIHYRGCAAFLDNTRQYFVLSHDLLSPFDHARTSVKHRTGLEHQAKFQVKAMQIDIK